MLSCSCCSFGDDVACCLMIVVLLVVDGVVVVCWLVLVTCCLLAVHRCYCDVCCSYVMFVVRSYCSLMTLLDFVRSLRGAVCCLLLVVCW